MVTLLMETVRAEVMIIVVSMATRSMENGAGEVWEASGDREIVHTSLPMSKKRLAHSRAKLMRRPHGWITVGGGGGGVGVVNGGCKPPADGGAGAGVAAEEEDSEFEAARVCGGGAGGSSGAADVSSRRAEEDSGGDLNG